MTSTAIAERVYEAFLNTVVKTHVFGNEERICSGFVSDATAADIASGARIDVRPPRLCLISGKGGWSDTPAIFEKRRKFANVTLLDHLVSVTRGSLVLAEIDIRAAQAAISDDELTRRLARIAAAAFLHDADKMLEIERVQLLTVANVATVYERYGIEQFLKSLGVIFPPNLLLVAIEEVEPSRADRMRPGQPVLDRETRTDMNYVRLADRLDGAFLDSTKSYRHIEDELRNQRLFRSSAWISKAWRFIRMSDPHTPFLMDAFLSALSFECADPTTGHGHPPLFGVHHDGRFLCVIPAERSDELVDRALDEATRPIGAGMKVRVDINARGYIDLLDAPGTLEEVFAATADSAMPLSRRERLLEMSLVVAKSRLGDIEALLDPLGFGPIWSLSSHKGARIPIWRLDKTPDSLVSMHRFARTVNSILACKDDPGSGIPDYLARETELIKLLGDNGVEIPAWILELPLSIDRAPMISALVGAHARPETKLETDVMALLATWLTGAEGREGLNSRIRASGNRLSSAVKRHFKALMSGGYVEPSEPDDENHPGRCLFTNQPAGSENEITTKTNLYGVKVSAFSGRQGRPAFFLSAAAQTLVSPIAEAEHRLRRHVRSSGDRIPILISSPTDSGLFATMIFRRSNELRDLSFYDLMRSIRKDNRPIFDDATSYERRDRIGRYEEMPTKLVSDGNGFGQISFIRATFECALRAGRPIHVFRGAPISRQAFVAFDFLPPVIEMALGGSEFRLEQIHSRIQILDIIEKIAGEAGFGVELACEIANPKTRFAAACDAWNRALKLPEHRAQQGRQIERLLSNLLKDSAAMTQTDSAIVKFAQTMALVQRMPRRDDGANVVESTMRDALFLAENSLEPNSRDSLVAALSGMLQTNIERRSLFAATYKPVNLEVAARAFVDGIWFGLLKGVAPSAKIRRMMIATYRWAFTSESTRLYLERKAAESDDASEEAEVHAQL